MSVTVLELEAGPFYPNGVTTTFPFGFKAISAAEVRVFFEIDGQEVDVDEGRYSVATSGDGEGGSVTFTVAPSPGEGTLFLALEPLFDQQASFSNGGFLPTALNPAFDRGALRDLKLKSMVDRAIILPRDPTTVANTFPAVLPDGSVGFTQGTSAPDIAVVAAENAREGALAAQAGADVSAGAAALDAVRGETAADRAEAAETAALVAAAGRYGVFANAYAAAVPQGVSAINITAAGAGGAAGTYAGGVAGGPAGFAWTYTIAGGVVTSTEITNPGLATTNAAPVLSFPNGGVTGATATATVTVLVPNTGNYLVLSADGRDMLVYYNNAGAAAARNDGGGSQYALPLRRRTDAVAAAVHKAFTETVVNSVDLLDPIEEIFVIGGTPEFEDTYYVSRAKYEFYAGIPLYRLDLWIADYDGNDVAHVDYDGAVPPGTWLTGYQGQLANKSYIVVIVKLRPGSITWPSGIRNTVFTKQLGAIRPANVVGLDAQREMLATFKPATIARAGQGLDYAGALGATLSHSRRIYPAATPVYSDYPIDDRTHAHRPVLIDLPIDGHNEQTSDMVVVPFSVIRGRGWEKTRLYNGQADGGTIYTRRRVLEFGHPGGVEDLTLEQRINAYIAHIDIQDVLSALSQIGDPVQHYRVYQFFRRVLFRSGPAQDAWGIGMGIASNSELDIEDCRWEQQNPTTTQACIGVHNSPGQHAGGIIRVRRTHFEMANPANIPIALLGSFPQNSRNRVYIEDCPSVVTVGGSLTMSNGAAGMPRRARDRWPWEVYGNVNLNVIDAGMDVLAVEAGTSITGTAGPSTAWDIFGPRYDSIAGRGEYLANDATDTGNIGNAVWGDRTAAPKTLTFSRAGVAVETYNVNQDYRGMTRAQILAHMNAALVNFNVSAVNIAGDIGAIV